MSDLLYKGYGIGAIHNTCAPKRESTGQNPVEGRSILQMIEIWPIMSAFSVVSHRGKALFEQLILH